MTNVKIETAPAISNREYTGEMPMHYATLNVTINGETTPISVNNFIPGIVWDKTVIDMVMIEVQELIAANPWTFKLTREKLEEVTRAEIAINRAARNGRYKVNRYFGKWLEEMLEHALGWSRDKESDTVLRILMLIVNETYNRQQIHYDCFYKDAWSYVKQFGYEEKFYKWANTRFVRDFF